MSSLKDTFSARFPRSRRLTWRSGAAYGFLCGYTLNLGKGLANMGECALSEMLPDSDRLSYD
jgi:hypothetical protein